MFAYAAMYVYRIDIKANCIRIIQYDFDHEDRDVLGAFGFFGPL